MARLAFVAAMALAVAACSPAPAEPTGSAAALIPDLPRSRIVLMSSLPLVYGEPADINALIAGEAQPHPLYEALDAAHDLVVADALDAQTLAGADLVILAQPRALPPAALMALDDYVRDGGRLLLFTDPALEWPSRFGMGDPRGPLRSALISPLLAHWGLELTDPGDDSARLPQSGAVLVKPGAFAQILGKAGDARCMLLENAHVARCTPGEGLAILVADADLLHPSTLQDSADSGGDTRRFVGALLTQLLGGAGR